MPRNEMLAAKETLMAKQLRSMTVNHMYMHVSQYNSYGIQGINADMPAHTQYTSMMDRITSMANDGTFAGEFELDACARATGSTILVKANGYSRKFGSGLRHIMINYDSRGNNGSGHYSLLSEQ